MFFFIFFVVVVFSGLEASEDQCEESSCSHHGPTVRFPFWLNGYQSHHCGYPGFELSCTDRKETVMELPFSGKFFVQSIDYKSQLVDVRDPNGCIFRRLLHFNFSASPFQQSPRLYDHYPDDSPRPSITPCVLFNCSSTISVPPDNAYGYAYAYDEGTLINCLSISGYPVYAFSVRGSLDALLYLQSCSSVTTISLSYLSEYDVRDSYMIKKYESDPNLGILLNWSVPVCRDCEARGKMCRLKNHTSGPKTECYDFRNPPVKPPGKSNMLFVFLINVDAFMPWIISSEINLWVRQCLGSGGGEGLSRALWCLPARVLTGSVRACHVRLSKRCMPKWQYQKNKFMGSKN